MADKYSRKKSKKKKSPAARQPHNTALQMNQSDQAVSPVVPAETVSSTQAAVTGSGNRQPVPSINLSAELKRVGFLGASLLGVLIVMALLLR